MKRFMSMILMAAVVVTSVVVPNSNNVETVKAMSGYSVGNLTVNGQKYDSYEDFLEAVGIVNGYEKVDLDAYSGRYYRNGDVEIYYTYRQCLVERNYEIPEDCTSVLSMSYYDAYVAYKADGTKVIVYNGEGYDKEGFNKEGYTKDGYGKDGYDKEGYDRNGYNKNGYNREGYDENGKTQEENETNDRNKAISEWKKVVLFASNVYGYDEACGFFGYDKKDKNQIRIKVRSTNVKQIYHAGFNYNEFEYHGKKYDFSKNVIIKKKNVNKNGYGEYTIICGDDETVKVDVVKTPGSTMSIWSPSTYEKKYVKIYNDKVALKYYDGFQLITSSKENGKGKVYFKKNYKLKAPNHKYYSYYPVYKYNNSKNAKYVTVIPYIKVNGKKYYANWDMDSVPNKNTSGKGRIYHPYNNSL